MWDLAFGCFLLAKELKIPPAEIAKNIVAYIQADMHKPEWIEKVEIQWVYINFFLKQSVYSDAFIQMMNRENLYENISWDSSETIYVDYIGANVGKPLHIGHMCSPIQWQVFVNLFKKLGYNVISDSHIWDWGIIFWKLIIAFNKYWDETKLHENAVEHLFQLYVQISSEAEENAELEQAFREAFKNLSQGDAVSIQLWEKFTKYSITAMNHQLGKMWVYPLYNIGESFYEGIGLPKIENYPDLKYSMKDIVTELVIKNIATKNDDGSVGVVFPEEMKIPSCILQKRDGTHWYLASDLASVKYRMDNWNPKKILYFVDVRQQLHLKQCFLISQMAEWISPHTELTHALNGFISLKDGAMSTRKGKIIKLEALLHEWNSRAKQIILEKRDDISWQELEELSQQISLWAIKYWYLKKSRTGDVIFDWDEFMTFEGNSGPYIQYAYVRAKKIIEKYQHEVSYSDITFSLSEEKQLMKSLLWFESMILDVSGNYLPHIICQYIYDTTKNFSAFYTNIPILSEENEAIKNSRIALVGWFIRIIEESFEILAIPLPSKM